MRCLFIDTSSNYLSLALISNGQVLTKKVCKASLEHSKYGMLGIEEIYKKTSLKPDDIDKIFIVNGPGSWTGIRIGVTLAKVYAWALQKEIIPVSSLKAYALSYSGYDYYLSVIDARRGYVYAGIYDHKYEEILLEQYISVDSLNQKISSLNGTILTIGNIDVNLECKSIEPDLDILKIVKHYDKKEAVNPHLLKPNYLKRTEAEEKKESDIE